MSDLNMHAPAAQNVAPIASGTIQLDGRLPPTPRSGGRVDWLDAARGIGIVLVVLGHSLGGLMSGGLASFDGPFGVVFVLIYTFHMPLFFALSAIFLPDRLNRGYRRILDSALIRIVYPYLVWGMLQFVVITLMGKAVNTPVPFHWLSLVAVLWDPPSQFWFLYALFLFQLVAIVFHRLADLRIMFAVAIAARLLPEFVDLPKILDMSFRYWIYYAAAVNCAAVLRDRRTFEGVSVPMLLGLVLAWLGAAFVSFKGGGDQSLWDIPAAVLGTILFLKLSLMATSMLRNGLVWLGLRSMPIFVTHVLIVAGVRIIFTHVLGIDEPVVILVVATGAGLVLPCLFFDWAKRRGIASALALE